MRKFHVYVLLDFPDISRKDGIFKPARVLTMPTIVAYSRKHNPMGRIVWESCPLYCILSHPTKFGNTGFYVEFLPSEEKWYKVLPFISQRCS